MKIYSVTFFLYDDEINVIVTKDVSIKEPDHTLSYHIKTWFGEPNWHKIFSIIGFFDNAQYVYICPRFDNADELTSEPKEIGFNEETGEVINYGE